MKVEEDLVGLDDENPIDFIGFQQLFEQKFAKS